jgi:hypothetical protein
MIGDYVALRARKGTSIRYRIVADDTEVASTIPPSPLPLTTEEAIQALDSGRFGYETGGELEAWGTRTFIDEMLLINLENGSDPGDLRDFVTVSSDHYPDLAGYYADRIDRLLALWEEARP